MAGTLFVVATPIGNLEDITMRAVRILGQVRLIAAEDTRRTAHLLARYAIQTPTTSLHEHNEVKKAATLIERLERGDDIALVSDAGTPTISDPGQRLIQSAIKSGIRVEPVPGASAAVAALAGSGIGDGTFTFLGFPPVRSKDRISWFEQLRTAGRTVVFFEAPHRLRETLFELRRMIGDCNLSIARELTKVHEEFKHGRISELLPEFDDPTGEFTVIVDIGHSTDIKPAESLSPAQIFAEFCCMTNSGHLSRRNAIHQLARRHGMAPNDVYDAVEHGRKLAK
ncbi:MAG: 16S rRNA (cytidine(1402)-2'-O)-methyltransferase [Blastocatellia bacterium]|nr:MAG: 16S rRNA (cytidine(1402)-2'-O)-methyltransferase [Blastocatellia bacterium]